MPPLIHWPIAFNGRTQLSFFLLLADQAGYPSDLEDLGPEAFLNAMIASFHGDEARLLPS